MDVAYNNFITREEAQCLSVTWDGQMLAGTIKDGSKKTHAWEKFPDAVFLFEAPNTRKLYQPLYLKQGFQSHMMIF